MIKPFVVRRTLVVAIVIALVVTALKSIFPLSIGCRGLPQVQDRHELIIRALLAQTRAPFVDGRRTRQSAEEFFSAHPDCCNVSPRPSTFFDRVVFGDPGWEVHLVFKTASAIDEPGDDTYYEAFAWITPCGHVGESFGQSLKMRDIPVKYRY